MNVSNWLRSFNVRAITVQSVLDVLYFTLLCGAIDGERDANGWLHVMELPECIANDSLCKWC